MEECITPDRIANAIMQDTTYDGYYLFVEGNKDYQLYSRFVNEEECRIKEVFGYSKVIDTFRILSSRGFGKKVAIVDSDFRRILDDNINIDGIFQTDDHDIEVMIMKTNTIYDVIRIYCSKSTVERYQKTVRNDIIQFVFDLGAELGKLKLTNKKCNLGLSFKPKRHNESQLGYKSLFDYRKDLNFVGIDKLIDIIIEYSKGKSECMKSKDMILGEYKKVNSIEYDINQLVNGHDLSNILFLFIKKVLTSKKPLVDYNDIEDSLTLGYDSSDFMKTDLYKNMNEWAIKNEMSIFNKRM